MIFSILHFSFVRRPLRWALLLTLCSLAGGAAMAAERRATAGDNDRGDGYSPATTALDDDAGVWAPPPPDPLLANSDYCLTVGQITQTDSVVVRILDNDNIPGDCAGNITVGLTGNGPLFDDEWYDAFVLGTAEIVGEGSEARLIYTPLPVNEYQSRYGMDSVEYYIKCGTDSVTAVAYFIFIEPSTQACRACPGTSAKLSIHDAQEYRYFYWYSDPSLNYFGLSYHWYDSATGGALVGIPNSTGDSVTITKGLTPVQSVWMEARHNGVPFTPRVRVDLLMGTCGTTVPDACARTGSLIFRNDFGGNAKSDDKIPNVCPSLYQIDLRNADCNGFSNSNGFEYNYHEYNNQRQDSLQFTFTKTGDEGFIRLPGDLNYKGSVPRSAWYPLDDHSSPGDQTVGRFLEMHDRLTPNSNLVFGGADGGMNGDSRTTLVKNLCPGQEVYIAYWVANAEKTPTNVIRQRLEVIDGDPNYNIQYAPLLGYLSTGDVPQDSLWHQYGFSMKVPEGVTSLQIVIYNLSTGATVYGIDDIEVYLCVPPVSSIETQRGDTAVCYGAPFTLEGSYTDNGVFGDKLAYRWERFTGNPNYLYDPSSWTVVLGSEGRSNNGTVASSYTIPAVTSTDAGYYRMVVAHWQNIDNYACRATSKMLQLTVQGVVPGWVSENQVICENGTPAPLQSTVVSKIWKGSSHSGTYVHQWQISTDGGEVWTNVGTPETKVGYTSTPSPYSPPALTQTTQYRLKTMFFTSSTYDMAGVCDTAYSNTVTVGIIRPDAAGVVHVKQTGAGAMDGSSWADAYPGVADPLHAARTGLACVSPKIKEIWVAEGTYYPAFVPDKAVNTGATGGLSVRDYAFALAPGVKLYGGFPRDANNTEHAHTNSRLWLTDPLPEAADRPSPERALHESILSGDVGGTSANVTDNTYHVVIGAGGLVNENGNALIDGFTITGGNANAPNQGSSAHYLSVSSQSIYRYHGGGLSLSAASPTLSRLYIRENIATVCGSGLCNTSSSSPVITNGIISNNAGSPAVWNDSNSSSSFTDVAIIGNRASGVNPNGGGMYTIGAAPVLTRVTISNNRATGDGGGMYNFASAAPVLTDVLITGNRASGTASDGGGMYNGSGALPQLTRVVISDNEATRDGGGMYNTASFSVTLNEVEITGNRARKDGGGMYNTASLLSLSDVLIADNTAGNGFNNDGFAYSGNGGGMYNTASAAPVLNRVRITGNTANGDGGGGGMYNNSATPTLTDVQITGNTANGYVGGGGMYNTASAAPVLNRVRIAGNTANGNGGGMYNQSAAPALTNVLIAGNTTKSSGGGMYNSSATATLTNVTVAANYAAINNGGIQFSNTATQQVRNSILYGNISEGSNQDVSSVAPAIYSYSLVGGNVTNTGIILNDDPLYKNYVPAASEAPTTDGNYCPTACSPALNVGDDNLNAESIDLDGNPRKVGVIDLGAYEVAADALVLTPDAEGIVYVKENSCGNGSSWDDAYAGLAYPLLAAKTHTGIKQIWVAAGTYYPQYNAADGADDGSRDVAFVLVEGVKVYGGFPDTATAAEHGDLAARDPRQFLPTTLLSGNIGDPNLSTDNACHVVIGAGTLTDATVLNGFTVTGGSSEGDASGNLTVNSINISRTYGGGISLWGGASPALENLIISGNTANTGGGMYINGSAPTLTNAKITGNRATGSSTGSGGGGLFNQASPSSLTNVQITGNTSGGFGGGIYDYSTYTLVLTNVTIAGNYAGSGGGGIMGNRGRTNLRNSIVWGNYRDNITGTNLTYDHCLVEGITAAGIISTDNPQFVDDQPYQNAPTAAGDYSLQATSPAIDKGEDSHNPTDFDLAGNPRIAGDRIDLGAYEDTTTRVCTTAGDIAISDTTICAGGAATLTPTAAAITDPTFYWYGSQADATPFHEGPSYTTSSDSTFYIGVVGAGRCENAPGDRQSVVVRVVSVVPPEVTVSDPACEGGALVFSVPFGYAAYEWHFDDEEGALVGTGPSVSVDGVGSHTLVVHVQNEEGCWSAFATATAAVAPVAGGTHATNVKALSAAFDATPPTVTFSVSWEAGTRNCRHRDTVWVFVDYQPSGGGAWQRAPIGALPTGTWTAGGAVALEPGNDRGFWLYGNGSGGSYSATLTVAVTNADALPRFSWCVYASDYPPNAIEQPGGGYSLHGSPPFLINSGSIREPSRTLAPGTCITDLTDSTGCPGLVVDASAPVVTLLSAPASTYQTVNEYAAITPIRYSIADAGGLSVTGLPEGVVHGYQPGAPGTLTLSGRPTTKGTYACSVTVDGTNSCGRTIVTATFIVTAAVPDSTWFCGTQSWSEPVRNPAGCASAASLSTAAQPPAQYKNNGSADFGYYYNWTCVNLYGDKLCPSPWRVPRKADFEALKACSIYGSTLTNLWGISGRYQGNTKLQGSTNSFYWSATDGTTTGRAWRLEHSTQTSVVTEIDGYYYYGQQLRCVKDN